MSFAAVEWKEEEKTVVVDEEEWDTAIDLALLFSELRSQLKQK